MLEYGVVISGELPEMIIARSDAAARRGAARRVRQFARNRIVAGGEIFDEPVEVPTEKEKLFPLQHIPGDINCARGRTAARNFRPLTRFQMFSSSRVGSSKLCRDVLRGLHSIKYARDFAGARTKS